MTKVIGLDAGHGLRTSGKETPDKIKEWDLNDKVRDKVVELLKDYDVKIINVDNDEGYTDESLTSRRTMYVNQKVDAFVSIHHNANTGTWNSATGVEVYTDRNCTSKDTALANAIYKNLPKYTGLKGRGIKQANFAVINQNSVPAVLCEGGFMDSTIDHKVITSSAGQLGYAKAVAEGLINFLGLSKKGSSTTSSTSSVKTYTVQKGDTLSKIGQKTGIAWKTIADLNGIKFPYTIKVGQVLKLGKETTTSSSSTTTITPTTTTNTTTTTKKYLYGGIDYALVFDPTYYANKYPDVKAAFGTNATALWNHFKSHGMKEHRQGSANFNVEVYRNNYSDLRQAFGNDWTQYYKHYVQYGFKENRKAV